MMQLLEKIAVTDAQQEEYDIYVEKSEELDKSLTPLTSTDVKTFTLGAFSFSSPFSPPPPTCSPSFHRCERLSGQVLLLLSACA